MASASLEREEYALLYVIALVSAFVVALLVRQFLRRPDGLGGIAEDDLDYFDKALLTGGPDRVFETALVNLLERGSLVHAGKGKLAKGGRLSKHAVSLEKQIYERMSAFGDAPLSIAEVRRGIKFELEPRCERLRKLKLLPSKSRSRMTSVIPLLIMLSVTLGLGLERVLAGIEAKKPSAILLVSMALAIAASLIAFATPTRRTLRGDAFIQAIYDRFTELGPGVLTARSNVVMGTALLGCRVLTGTEYEPVAKALQGQVEPTSPKSSGKGEGVSHSTGGTFD